MPLHTRTAGTTTTIHVTGRFDYKIHQEFREAYRHSAQKTSFVVDLGGAEYLDSSALGMLLVLREHAGGDQAGIRISNCSQQVRKILQIAHFDRFFDIA